MEKPFNDNPCRYSCPGLDRYHSKADIHWIASPQTGHDPAFRDESSNALEGFALTEEMKMLMHMICEQRFDNDDHLAFGEDSNARNSGHLSNGGPVKSLRPTCHPDVLE
jgi:hypothetical protein